MLQMPLSPVICFNFAGKTTRYEAPKIIDVLCESPTDAVNFHMFSFTARREPGQKPSLPSRSLGEHDLSH